MWGHIWIISFFGLTITFSLLSGACFYIPLASWIWSIHRFSSLPASIGLDGSDWHRLAVLKTFPCLEHIPEAENLELGFPRGYCRPNKEPIGNILKAQFCLDKSWCWRGHVKMKPKKKIYRYINWLWFLERNLFQIAFGDQLFVTGTHIKDKLCIDTQHSGMTSWVPLKLYTKWSSFECKNERYFACLSHLDKLITHSKLCFKVNQPDKNSPFLFMDEIYVMMHFFVHDVQ